MAMAVSCSPVSSALGVVVPVALVSTCASTVSANSSQWRPACAPFSGHSVAISSGKSSSCTSSALVGAANYALRTVAAKAAADAPATASEETPAPAITTILSEAELIKKKAKKDELRRRRLVRKRKLRKKGKWPPSKMAKLKNV